jgi:hypothetical protein
VICACGSRAAYLTIDGDDVCGPCLRAQGAEARVPPMLLDLERERRHHRREDAVAAVVVVAPAPVRVVKPKPAPAPVVTRTPLPTDCRRCGKPKAIKARGLCSTCYGWGADTGRLDEIALPVVPGWQRAGGLKRAENARAKADA